MNKNAFFQITTLAVTPTRPRPLTTALLVTHVRLVTKTVHFPLGLSDFFKLGSIIFNISVR